MSKICAKCEKAVYPLEELKCLDKIWHKLCFKCSECGMTLNMKNYKGFNKLPYCSAHYPQTRHTVVADTPELQRLSQASKIQSQNAYQNEFKKSLGKYTQIADDQEMQRLKKNQENFSMAKYHEEFEKKIKGSKIQVTDDPESQRLKHLSQMVSQVEYKGLREKTSEMEAKRKSTGSDNYRDKPENNEQPEQVGNQSHSVAYTGQGKSDVKAQSRKIGSINDYNPSKQTQEWEETVPISRLQTNNSPAKQTRPSSNSPHNPPTSPHGSSNQIKASTRLGRKSLGMVCKALYDYTAQDTDEVTFKEEDVIINCEPIDEGWMYGTVQRTSLRGMLPSNYVEKVQ